MKTLDTARFTSPIGDIVLFADGERLVGLEFFHGPRRLEMLRAQLRRAVGEFAEREARDPAGSVTRLERYFGGDRDALAGQPVSPHGTEFQRRVWGALCDIPAGETRSYGGLAATIGFPSASRAVGAANGSNPISLVIPCHRVIAADGSLHGYGGGLDRKRWLLEHEGALTRETRGKAQLALI